MPDEKDEKERMNTLSNLTRTLKRCARNAFSDIKRLYAALFAFMAITLPQTANALADSSLAKGTEKLLQDATSWLMIIVPAVTVLVVIYYLIRRAAADEIEHKKWNSRIMAAIISCIIAVAVAALLNALTSYFV